MGGAVAETPTLRPSGFLERDRGPPRSGSRSQRQTEAADGQKQSRGASVGGPAGRAGVRDGAAPPEQSSVRETGVARACAGPLPPEPCERSCSTCACPRKTAASRPRTCFSQEPARPGREQGGCALPPRAAAWGGRLLPLGSSACLASLRSAAAKLEDGAAWADSALLVAGLPLGTSAPLSGEGVRGLTVAVVLVAVESIPSEGDLGSWLMPETGKEEPEVTQRVGGPSTRVGVCGARGSGASEQHAGTGNGSRRGRPRQDRQGRREPASQRTRGHGTRTPADPQSEPQVYPAPRGFQTLSPARPTSTRYVRGPAASWHTGPRGKGEARSSAHEAGPRAVLPANVSASPHPQQRG